MAIKNVWSIIIEVREEQKSYEKYLKLFQACVEQNLEDIFREKELLNLASYRTKQDLESPHEVKSICNQIELNINEKYREVEEKDAYQMTDLVLLHFRLLVDENYDVTNLQYFFLIKQYLKHYTCKKRFDVVCKLILLNEGNISILFPISNFLIFENQKEKSVYVKNYSNDKENIEKYGYVTNLPGASRWSDRRISQLVKAYPLLEVNQESYLMLAGTVRENLSIMGFDKEFPKGRTINYFKNGQSRDILIDMSIQYFIHGLRQTEKVREELFYSKEFKDAVQGMSLLSFLIMCSFEYFLSRYNEKNGIEIELSMSEIKRKINLSTSIANGLLQIIENIVMHTRQKEGYFSFCVRKNDYCLRKSYESYFEKNPPIEHRMYLEIKVSDLELENKKTEYKSMILKCFVESLERRIELGEKHIKRVKNIFMSNKVSIKDFFMMEKGTKRSINIWKKYYEQTQNWMLHYGLRLYSRIIEKAHGYFRVNSQYGWESLPEKQYYDTQESKEPGYFLPGTQYHILIPYVAEYVEQGHIGIDSSINSVEMLHKLMDGKIKVQNISALNVLREIKNCTLTVFGQSENEGFKLAQEDKEKILNCLIKEIQIRSTEKVGEQIKYIPIWDMKRIEKSIVQELMAKAFWAYAISEDNSEELCFAIKGCSYEMMRYIANVISVYFAINPEKVLKQPIQIYVCGDDCDDDFLISGSFYSQIRSNAYKHAASKGQFSEILSYFFVDLFGEYPMVQTLEGNTDMEELLVLPFDMLIKNGGNSRFINQVEHVLERKISAPEYGCKLENIHVRIGSKVHVNNFYEAELLFQDSYFSKRMAFLVADDIWKKLELADQNADFEGIKNLIMIGYENYSEMFLCDIQEFLMVRFQKSKIKHYRMASYGICLNINDNLKLQGLPENISFQNTEFIIIVSINSTLTTHNKIEGILKKKADNVSIFMNYAVLLFRDGNGGFNEENLDNRVQKVNLESEYWKEIDPKEKYIKSRFGNKEIIYFIERKSGWQSALRCPICFPEIALNEKPLIATTKTSVIPAMQYGLSRNDSEKKWIQKRKNRKERDDEYTKNYVNENIILEERTKILAKYVRYGHINRNDNHFLYYFDTKGLFEESSEQIRDWLRNEIKDRVSQFTTSNNIPIYNILVTPSHESNTGFVEMINKEVFGNAAYIVRFEVNRMYRDNIIARYSNLKELYSRLKKMCSEKEKAYINLYYADDTVISGRTYERAYSLMNSLFCDLQGNIHISSEEHVIVHIFKGCFTLLNRMSKFSMMSLMKSECKHYYFYDVPISSIRNHEDFCFMCTLIKSAKQMREKSSTNQVAQGWKKVEKRFKLKAYSEYVLLEEKQERYQNRFYSAFWSGVELRRLGNMAEDPKTVYDMIIRKLFIDRVLKQEVNERKKLELFISYVKVLSRPFLNYRWKLKEAIMYFILLFLEVFLKSEISSKNKMKNFVLNSEYGLNVCDELYELFPMIKKYRKIENLSVEELVQAYDLLVVLIKQSMELGSNYIIRKDNIKNIMEKYQGILKAFDKLENKRKKETEKKVAGNSYLVQYKSILDFEFNYIRYVKQLTALSGDEKKCVWLERLLVLGTEFPLDGESEDKKEKDRGFVEKYGISSRFGQMLYMENTYTVLDALYNLNTDLKKCKNKIIDKAVIQNILEDPQRYYYKSFLDILWIHGWAIKDEYYEINEDVLEILTKVIALLRLLHEKNNQTSPEKFYEKIICYMAEILNCEKLQCLVADHQKENDMFCLMEVRAKGGYYEIEDGNHSPLITGDILDKDYVLRTWQFYKIENGKTDKEYLIVKFESDTAGINEHDVRGQKEQSIRPLHYICEITGRKREEIFYKLRWILILRRDILHRLEQDFKSNAFQYMVQEKNEKQLLSNWKNSTHTDHWIYSCVIGLMDEFMMCRQQKGSLKEELMQCTSREEMQEIFFKKEKEWDCYRKNIEGSIFRLLTDSIVSRKYHTSLTGEMDKKYDIHNSALYAFKIPFEDSILWRYRDELYYMPQESEGAVVCETLIIDEESLRGKSIFVSSGETEQGMLMIIPLIQNALKYAAFKTKVKLYCGDMITFYSKNASKHRGLLHLCVENYVQEPIENMVEEMKHFILEPVGKRENANLDSQNGISLYTVNQYLKRLISLVFKEEMDFKEPPLKVELQDGHRMIVKIPILAGEEMKEAERAIEGGESYETYYYM